MTRRSASDMTSAVVSVRGKRRRAEDTHVLVPDFLGRRDWLFGAVFDGHGGCETARYASNNFLRIFSVHLLNLHKVTSAFKKTFEEIDESVKELDDGATAACFLLRGSKLVTATVGDSRIALISEEDFDFSTPLHRLSNGHELRRVVLAGAQVFGPYAGFPDGRGLMTTRSIGSHDFREIGIISEPSISEETIGRKYEYLVAATDGLWDSLEIEVIKGTILRRKSSLNGILNDLVRQSNLEDNLTAIIVRFALQ